jgi:uncharacterized protein
MKIRLDQIHDEPFTWHETLSVPAAQLDRPELGALSDIDCRGRIVRIEPGLYLAAHLRYEQTLACDRCLAPIHRPVESTIELMLEGGPGTATAGEPELKEVDLGVLQVEGGVLDTAPLVAEELQLDVPMKPLCRPDCRGLCPGCGMDLNEAPCRCAAPAVDSRWAALAALRGRLS